MSTYGDMVAYGRPWSPMVAYGHGAQHHVTLSIFDVPCHACYAMRFMPLHAMPLHAMPLHAMPCMLCNAVPCMLRHATPC